MRTAVSVFASLCVFAVCSDASAQSRTWRDVHGNVSSGTFQRFTKDKKGDLGNDRVVVRANGRIVGLKFWELMPDSQQYVKEKLEGDPDGEHLEITDVPREWKSRAGVTGTGQFLKVEKNGMIAVVINSEKKLFGFDEFSDLDQDYIRTLLTRTGEQDLVPAKPIIPDSQTEAVLPSTTDSTFTPPGFPSSPPAGFESSSSSFPGIAEPLSIPLESNGAFATSSPPGFHHPQMSLPDVAHRPSDFEPLDAIPTSIPGSGIPSDSSSFSSRLGSCSNCGKSVTRNSKTCPYCNTLFEYYEDEFGNRTEIKGNELESFRRRWGKGVVRGALLLLAVVVGGLVKFFKGRS